MIEWAKIGWAWVRRYLLAPLPALVVVVVALLLVAFGARNIKIGGLLGRLFGRAEGRRAIDVANSVPEDRVDSAGRVIPVGQPDSQGMAQAVVVPVETGGLFDDPAVVKVRPPGQDKPVVVHLPDGIESKDVAQVVLITPEVVAVTVKEGTANVTVQQIDDLLRKYGT